MEKTTFTDAQIISILKQAEQGVPAAQFCREHGMGNSTFYKWWAKYGRMDVLLMAEMKSLGASLHENYSSVFWYRKTIDKLILTIN
ncbi:TPA: transposase [Providencia rettgeri]|nr:transposase [Providencia rettgeri]